MLRVAKFEGPNDEWSREGIYSSKRSCYSQVKSTDFMNRYYCVRNQDERPTEGRARENVYQSICLDSSQTPCCEYEEKKGHIGKNCPGRIR